MKPSAALGWTIAAALLLAPHVVAGPYIHRDHVTDLLTGLKVGQWIRLVGMIQSDNTVQCTEVKLLTGDFLDDDWNLLGAVSSVDHRKREFMIGPIRVHVIDIADYDSQEGTIRRFSDVRPGLIVEVDGTYTKDRTFVAKEVDDESAEIRPKLGIERQIQLVGKVERVDIGRRRITSMGTVFRVTSLTQLKSVLR